MTTILILFQLYSGNVMTLFSEFYLSNFLSVTNTPSYFLMFLCRVVIWYFCAGRCVLGNTTILAEFAGEEDVNRFFAQGQSLGATTTSWHANPGSNQNRMGGNSQSHSIGQWSSGGGGGGGSKASGSDLLWGGVPQYSSLWGPPNGEDARVIGSPTPINTLLPGDLLSGESM